MIDLRDHLGIVKTCVGRYAPHALREDCEQAGMVGLWKAAQRFDESKGTKFATFAHHYVHGAIVDEIRSQQFGGRRKHLHRSRPVSLEEMQRDRDLLGLPPLEIADPTDHYADTDFVIDWRAWLLVLPIKHWFVVQESVLRDRTIVSVAADLGVTDTRVSQIRTEAFAMLRQVVAA